MSNNASYSIIEYATNNNITFDQEGFNNVDGLIMTQISNMHLEDCGIDLGSGNSKTISDIWDILSKSNKLKGNQKKLLEAMAGSDRYKNMEVSNFVEDPVKNNISGFKLIGTEATKEQFAAVTITYKQDGETINYMSFRATDSSLDGWAENLSMLAYDKTQAQNDSATYMNLVAKELDGKLVGGGHSKGGNDFQYGYMYCDEEVRKRIVQGYVYDNPGMNKDVIDGSDYYDEYLKIIDGHRICPEDSIIGQLLVENPDAIYVYSCESGFYAHDPYSWEINKNSHDFVSGKQTSLSVNLNKQLDSYVDSLSSEDKAVFYKVVCFVFYTMGKSFDVDDFDDILENFTKDVDFDKFIAILANIYVLFKGMDNKEVLSTISMILSMILLYGYVTVQEIDFSLISSKPRYFITPELIERYLGINKNSTQNSANVVIDLSTDITSKVSEIIYGYQYAESNSKIKINTEKMKLYAQRLQALNKRITNLDSRLNSLYKEFGLLDLWSLIQDDALTDYSGKLTRCSSYLTETAIDFDKAELNISNNL